MLLTAEKNNLRDARILALVFDTLPERLVREILRVGSMRRDFPSGLSEVRVRGRGRSALVLSGENIPLMTKVGMDEVSKIYDRVIGGSAYAHTGETSHGFVSLSHGIRVGISARLSDRGLVSEVSSLVFRLPTSPSENAEEIFSLWKERKGGALIYSLPGEGKTSALRALAGLISQRLGLRVLVIDERREFILEEYERVSVDILSGYAKSVGLEIALRTMSAEVVIIDEIGNSEETEALLRVGRGGVPIIATAHAASFDEVIKKRSVSMLFDEGYFNLFVRLYREGGAFRCEHRYV